MLGQKCSDMEIKGQEIFKRYFFRLEWKGIRSHQLDLARDILDYAEMHGAKAFASVMLDQREVDLTCADGRQLERPFFFLFERINLCMKENYPDRVACLAFDDRGIRQQVGDGKVIAEFWKKIKRLEYKSETQVKTEGKSYHLFGFKIAREQQEEMKKE